MQIEFLVSRCKRSDEILRDAERVFNIILYRTESQFALNEECERMIRMIKEYMGTKNWFYGKPKKKGYYWYKNKHTGEVHIAYFDGEDYEYGFSNIGYDGPVSLKDFGKGVQWFGPIDEPVKEPEEK